VKLNACELYIEEDVETRGSAQLTFICSYAILNKSIQFQF